MTWVYVASGFASLVYQVAWQRMLTLHTGTSALSTTLVVSAWMLGLGAGALLGGQVARRVARPRLAYAGTEAALAGLGLASLPAARLAVAWLDLLSPAAGYVAIFASLLVPTALMGATLPLLAAIAVRSPRQFTASVSHLYFANTIGAAAGALFSGYVLVSVIGLGGCALFAASINLALAGVMLALRRPDVASDAGDGQNDEQAAPAPRAGVARGDPRADADVAPAPLAWPPVIALAFASGFLAIGYEIAWYRLVGVLVKDSPYAFASILAIYLLGIALGSLALSWAARRASVGSGRELFCGLQFLAGLVALATVAGFFHLADREPLRTLIHLSFTSDVHPPVVVFGSTGRGIPADLFLLLDVVFWPAVFVLAPTALAGASIPLLASLRFGRRESAAPVVGGSYAAVVSGNVAGGLMTGLVLLPALGTERSLLAFGLAGLLFGLGVARIGRAAVPLRARLGLVALAVIAAIVIFPGRGKLYAAMHVPPFQPAAVRISEGRDAVVVTYERDALMRNFINGQGHGYRPGPMFFAEAVAALGAGQAVPRRVLIVGLGAGSIAEAALLADGTEQVSIVELCESVVENLRGSALVAPILGDPRSRLTIDDGRRFLRRSADRFDAILLDPMRTTTASSNNLHSKEFFALAASRLSPGGVIMVGGIGDSRVVPRTLMAVFAHVRWYEGYCVASDAPLADGPRRDRLLRALPPDTRKEVDALSLEALEGGDLQLATRGAPINEDWRPVSEYYLLRRDR